MEKLKAKYNGFILYNAGLPKYPRNFSRDSIISGILMQDPKMLKQQLSFCAKKQGKRKNPYSGEEPGKIFHECPPVKRRGLSTEYNACDTTALFLMGHEIYQKLTGDEKFAEEEKENILKAVDYIKTHLKEYAFIEDPKFSNGKKFALKITYWKDSEIFGRENGEPEYPIIYTLVHIQNMRGLRSAYFLLKDEKLKKLADKMVEYLMKNLFNKSTNNFYLAIDEKGKINAVSSDSLHALFYLNPKDIKPKHIKQIVNSSSVLETKIGYRTLSEECAKGIKDKYHAKTVWPFEQALINIGARKFGLKHVEEVSLRIVKYLKTNHELFIIEKERIKRGGNNIQLWTIAAKKYFKSYQGIFL